MPKFWLDEAHMLDCVDKEEKFATLSELVDDIDNFIKAIRAACSREQADEVLKYAKEELAPRLNYSRLEAEFEERLEQGLIKAPLASKFKHASPIEFLRWQIKKKTLGEDADDAVMLDVNAIEESESSDDAATDDEKGTSRKTAVPLMKGLKPKAVRPPTIKGAKPKKEKSEKGPRKEKGVAKKREAKAAAKTEKKVSV